MVILLNASPDNGRALDTVSHDVPFSPQPQLFMGVYHRAFMALPMRELGADRGILVEYFTGVFCKTVFR
jgi:hypothetical protein